MNGFHVSNSVFMELVKKLKGDDQRPGDSMKHPIRYKKINDEQLYVCIVDVDGSLIYSYFPIGNEPRSVDSGSAANFIREYLNAVGNYEVY